MSEETLQAVAEAARSHVSIRALQKAAGEKLAELTRNEAAYVTTGAAAGLYLAAAACVAVKLGCVLGHLTPSACGQCEVIVFRAHRNPYDWSLRQLGVKLAEVGYPNTLEPITTESLVEAINENTAAIFYTAGGGWVAPGALSLEKTLAVARKFGVPVIVDAAAQLPPVENLWRLTEMGATAAVFSGGKDLRGPQASGLIVGRKWLVDMFYEKAFPTHGIGRMLKVGREEIAGLTKAVEQYVAMDHDARCHWCEEQVRCLIEKLSPLPGVVVDRSFPNEAGQPLPRAVVRITEAAGLQNEKPARALMEILREGNPGIYVKEAGTDGIYINPMTLTEAEMPVVVTRLKAALEQLVK